MQFVRMLAAASAAFFASVAVARAVGITHAELLPSKVDVKADTVAFFPYTNQTLLSAQGHVIFHTGSRTIVCDSLRWDLQKNQITATGNVRVTGGGGELDGVAYARDLTNGTGYLVSVDPIPATYAVRNDDPTSESEGPAPTGLFETTDLDGARPFMRSHHAIVTPNAAIRMDPVEFPTGAGPSLKLPAYLYTLVQNQYIGQSAAPYASFDQPYNLFGSPNSLTAAHLRYDSYNGVTEAIDERLVDGNRAYFVASVLPFRDKQVDFLSFEQLRPGLQQTLSGTHTFGAYPQNIYSYRLQESGKLLTQTISLSNFDASNSAEFDLGTYEHDIPHLLGYQIKTSYGYDHNYGGYPYSNDFRAGADAYVTTPHAKILGVSLGAKYEEELTKYDYPHEVTTATTTVTADRQVTAKIHLFAQAIISQSDNRYRYLDTGRVALGLPAPDAPYFAPDGTPYPGYFAYTGLNTYRSYELQSTFNGRGDNRVQFSFYYDHDFPQFHGFGRPPFFAYLDITRRITSSLRIELGRSYSFGWNGQHLSPEYTFAISP